MGICNEDEHFTANLVFSDKLTFCLNGQFLRHDSSYWSNENIQCINEAHAQYP